MSRFTILLLISLISIARAAPPTTQPSSPFTIVLIDKSDLSVLGPFPFDRSVFADAVIRAANDRARGVVLKFFFDHARSDDGDYALADAMSRTKVLLEAHLDDTEPNPNDLPARFTLPIQLPADHLPHALSATSGWLPLSSLAESAADIGFADSPPGARRIPAIERYRDHYVKSLWTCCLELATNSPASIIPGKSLHLAGKTLPLDQDSMLPAVYPDASDLHFISLREFLHAPNRQPFRDQIIIIGWTADDTGAVQTPLGKLTPHRAFCYTLLSLWGRFQSTPAD